MSIYEQNTPWSGSFLGPPSALLFFVQQLIVFVSLTRRTAILNTEKLVSFRKLGRI